MRNLSPQLRIALVALGLILLTSLRAEVPAPVPTDIDRLNRFADTYNVYVQHLRDGRIDLKSWERVRRSWHDLAE